MRPRPRRVTFVHVQGGGDCAGGSERALEKPENPRIAGTSGSSKLDAFSRGRWLVNGRRRPPDYCTIRETIMLFRTASLWLARTHERARGSRASTPRRVPP